MTGHPNNANLPEPTEKERREMLADGDDCFAPSCARCGAWISRVGEEWTRSHDGVLFCEQCAAKCLCVCDACQRHYEIEEALGHPGFCNDCANLLELLNQHDDDQAASAAIPGEENCNPCVTDAG